MRRLFRLLLLARLQTLIYLFLFVRKSPVPHLHVGSSVEKGRRVGSLVTREARKTQVTQKQPREKPTLLFFFFLPPASSKPTAFFTLPKLKQRQASSPPRFPTLRSGAKKHLSRSRKRRRVKRVSAAAGPPEPKLGRIRLAAVLTAAAGL